LAKVFYYLFFFFFLFFFGKSQACSWHSFYSFHEKEWILYGEEAKIYFSVSNCLFSFQIYFWHVFQVENWVTKRNKESLHNCIRIVAIADMPVSDYVKKLFVSWNSKLIVILIVSNKRHHHWNKEKAMPSGKISHYNLSCLLQFLKLCKANLHTCFQRLKMQMGWSGR